MAHEYHYAKEQLDLLDELAKKLKNNMKTTKTINISGAEILEYFVSLSENCTISEAREIISKSDIFWDIKETGDHDRGTYDRFLKSVEITIER